MTELRGLLATFDWANGFTHVATLNGSCYLHLAGAGNRPGRYPDDLDQLFRFIEGHAPGTNGLLYWRDDENPAPPGTNAFRVHVTTRGRTTIRVDPFLSPINPTVED